MLVMAKQSVTRRTFTQSDRQAAANLRWIWDKKHKALGLTQARAGELFGDVTQGAIGHYLNGRAAIGPVATLKFARLLEVNPTDIRPDFEFKLIPGDLPQDVIEMAIKLASFPPDVRADIAKYIDGLSTDSYQQYLKIVKNVKQVTKKAPV